MDARGVKQASFETNYSIEVSYDQIKSLKDELSKCEAAILKYYQAHKYVAKATLQSQEHPGRYSIKVSVHMQPNVVQSLCPLSECSDQVEFIEQVTAHLQQGQFESTNDPIDRKIIEMVNLLESRQVVFKQS